MPGTPARLRLGCLPAATRPVPLDPALLNEALIELGALVCLPRRVNCADCPLRASCRAHRAGTELTYPSKPTVAEKPREYWTALLLFDRSRGRFLIEKRPAQGLLAALWQFPMYPDSCEAETVRELFARPGITLRRLETLPPKAHVFSHRIWELSAYRLEMELSPAAERALLTAGFSAAAENERPAPAVEYSPPSRSAVSVAAEPGPPSRGTAWTGATEGHDITPLRPQQTVKRE